MSEPQVTVSSQEVTLTVYAVKCDSCSFHRTVADFTVAHDLRFSHEEGHRDGQRLGKVVPFNETEDKT